MCTSRKHADSWIVVWSGFQMVPESRYGSNVKPKDLRLVQQDAAEQGSGANAASRGRGHRRGGAGAGLGATEHMLLMALEQLYKDSGEADVRLGLLRVCLHILHRHGARGAALPIKRPLPPSSRRETTILSSSPKGTEGHIDGVVNSKTASNGLVVPERAHLCFSLSLSSRCELARCQSTGCQNKGRHPSCTCTFTVWAMRWVPERPGMRAPQASS